MSKKLAYERFRDLLKSDFKIKNLRYPEHMQGRLAPVIESIFRTKCIDVAHVCIQEEVVRNRVRYVNTED